MKNEKILEFDKVKEKWGQLALTKAAKEKIRNAGVFLSEAELEKNLRDTTNAKELIEKCGTPPLTALEDIEEILAQAGAGSALTGFQLEKVAGMLVAVKRLKEYLERGKQYQNSLAFYEENLDSIDELREEINRQIRGGQVDDRASKTLMQIRNDIIHTEDKMKQKAEAVMRAHKDCMADSFCTYRNGRLCIPVKKDCKLKISGSVIDKSATGSTLFMEPTTVAKHYEELQLLRIDEENEIFRILYTLTAMVQDNIYLIRQNVEMMEKLDFIFSKGKLSVDMRGTEPSINTDRKLMLKEARHPLMDPAICVPLNLEMTEDVKGIIITGPNTGGKTVSIKTVALNCMMAQSGLHVTCKEADICMNSGYLCDIGDGQNLSENLSTFSAHIKSVMDILHQVDRESFVIMDELGSGTDPTEGMGIAIAILEKLRQSNCLFLVTTHYPEVKEYAAKAENIVNARMTFDKETLRPTYRMIVGEAGESCAFYIAEKLGMPKDMLEIAQKAAYGKAYVAETVDCSDSGHMSKSKIRKNKPARQGKSLADKYRIGDSVMVYPDKKIGIVCNPINEKGVLRVQLPGKKIWINHKRVKLHVKAEELYPEDYDFSIIFDTVEQRKARHEMERKLTSVELRYEE